MNIAERFKPERMYTVYSVEILLRNKIAGGKPKNPELLAGWIASTTGHNDEITQQQIEEAKAVLLEPTEEKSWNGFSGDPQDGLYIDSRAVKAMFKESASMLRIFSEKRGTRNVLQHAFEVKGFKREDRIYLGVKEPDGYDEGPIHVQTPQGPRTAIKRVDYVLKPTLAFYVWVLGMDPNESRYIGEEDMVAMLTFAQENGLGADRSQGQGKFDVTKFELVKKAEFGARAKEPKPAKGKKNAAEEDRSINEA